jgi:hypothetical protein
MHEDLTEKYAALDDYDLVVLDRALSNSPISVVASTLRDVQLEIQRRRQSSQLRSERITKVFIEFHQDCEAKGLTKFLTAAV